MSEYVATSDGCNGQNGGVSALKTTRYLHSIDLLRASQQTAVLVFIAAPVCWCLSDNGELPPTNNLSGDSPYRLQCVSDVRSISYQAGSANLSRWSNEVARGYVLIRHWLLGPAAVTVISLMVHTTCAA